jgi:gluconokinase
MTRVLALDVGTSSVRAQLFDEDGREADVLERREYDGNDADQAARLVLEAADGRWHRADAVGVSCFGHSFVALDADDRPLTPIVGWRDTRSAAALPWLRERVDADDVHARTGCHLHASYWPAKLAWFQCHAPNVFARAARFVSFAEYLLPSTRRSVGFRASLSSASGTGLLNLATFDWDEELLGVLGVERERLPELTDEPVASWYPAWLDGACANVGAGCVGRTRAALTIGTSGALRVVYENDAPQPRPGLFLYRLDRHRVVEGGALSDGGNLHRWIERTLRDVDEELAPRDPDAHGLTFVTLLGGERSVGWSADATGGMAGLTFETTPADLREAALEGVAFRFAAVAAAMPELEEIVATGGALLHADDWLQIVADALGRPLHVSGVREGSLRGAAVLALERLGGRVDAAAIQRVVEPRAEHADAYAAARERQRALYSVAKGAETS